MLCDGMRFLLAYDFVCSETEQNSSHRTDSRSGWIAGTITQLDENVSDISVAVQQQDAVSKEIARSANAAAERTRDVSMSVVQVSDAAVKTDQVASAMLHAGG